MTNLTDEGLRFGIKEIVHIKRLGCVDPIEDLIFSFAKQVRDAAKKETVERCAHMVEDYPIPRFWDSVRDDILGGAAKAIRQMEGGK